MGEITIDDLDDPGLLFRPDVLDDPVPLYRLLHEHAPVWSVPGADTFLVTSAALVAEAVARIDDFSSNLDSLLFRGDDGCPVVFDMRVLGDATHVMATADPPVHTAHRKLLQPRLTTGCVAPLEDDLRTLVDGLLAPLLADGRADLMSLLADPLPAVVIVRVIGLPEADALRIVDLVLATNEILAGVVDADQMQRAARSAVEVDEYLRPHLARAVGAADDGTLLGAVGGAIAAGDMTEGEGLGTLVQVVAAGTETTTSLIGNAVRRLAVEPDLQDELRRDPGAVPGFLEEVLRLDGPFRFHYRSTHHPTSLGGVAIPAGARVLLMWAAANRDAQAYPEPDRLDAHRPLVRSHLAFGRGIHFCIGAPLARLEARVALEQLLARTERFALDPDAPPRLRPSIFVRRLASLPLRLG